MDKPVPNARGSYGPPAGYRATWAEVDLDRIAANFAALRALAGREAIVFPVVKANAYGHGATPVARRLESEGVAGLCVATAEEGLELRRAGISVPILCLGSIDAVQVVPAARQRITLTLYSPEQLQVFEAAGRAAGIPIQFHLKVETGLNRLGLLHEEVGPFLDELRSSRAALLCGLFSNLASADRPGETSNAEQGARLTQVAEAIRAAGHEPRPVHLANSAGLLYHPALRFDAVRPGLLLYGIRPGPGDSGPGFSPALALKSTVLRVKSVPAGSAVGYSASHRLSRDARLATIAIGYDDGLPRSLSGVGEVLIGGRRAPIVGAISMDLAVVDVTECGPVAAGDEVVIIGTQGKETLSAAEVAERAGTIPWEIFCRIGKRVPRVHVAGQEIVSVASPFPPAKETTLAPDTAKGEAKPKRSAPAADKTEEQPVEGVVRDSPVPEGS